MDIDYDSCNDYSSSSIIPTIYLIVYCVALLGLSLFSYIYLHQAHYNYHSTSLSAHQRPESWSIINWGKDLWYKRRCYIPLVTHFFDQATDVAVIVEFYNLWQAQAADDTICTVIRGRILFALSITLTCGYRFISATLIYRETKRISQFLAQFLFDAELGRTIFINYKLNKTEPCDPQKWIQSMEAVFEAAPQVVLQTYFVVVTRTFSFTIFLSVITSLSTIASKIVADDKKIFKTQYQDANLCKNGKIINKGYLIRVTWRLGDIASRIITLVAEWLVLGFYVFFGLRILEGILLGTVAIITGELSVVWFNIVEI